MPKFSIIVPVYKVESYLNQCVDSVFEQTYDDYELILVDDGSPDQCGQICDSYMNKYSNVKVIHKKNGGLSSARNAGLELASGEYIIFLDSDDFWNDKKALWNIHCQLKETQADLLVFPAQRFYEETNTITDIYSGKIDRRKIINCDKIATITYMISNNIYKAAAWNKVVKKSLIDRYNMRFKEGFLSEDMDWCGDLLLYAESYDFYNVPFYQYRQQRLGSITKTNNQKLVEDKLYMCEKGLSQAMSIANKEMSILLASYYAYEYTVLIGVSFGIKDITLINRIAKLKFITHYDLSYKVKQVKKLMNILGFNITRRILCYYVKTKK